MPRISRYKKNPMNVAAGINQAQSRAVSITNLSNWYPEATPNGTGQAALYPFPGLSIWGGAVVAEPSYLDRGLYVFNSTLYFIKGSYLYSQDESGTATSIGTIYGSNICQFADNGTVMLIVTGGPVYQYDGTSLTVLTDITFNPTSIKYLNGKFIFNSDTGNFWHTNPGTVFVDGANFAAPESNPDPFVAPYVFNQVLYLFGTRTVEPWRDVGSGNPSFERESQAIIDGSGCSSVHGICNTSDFMYFIDRSGVVLRIRSYQADVVSNHAISNIIKGYDLTRYTANAVKFNGHWFVIFNFYNDDKTLVYSENTGEFFNLTSGNSEGAWQGSSYAFCYGLHHFADRTNTYLYKLDWDTYYNSNVITIREKVFDFVCGEKFGDPRGWYETSKFYFGIEPGVGLVDGQGSDPYIMVSVSIDGKTWGNEEFIKIGRLGDFSREIEWSHFVRFQQLAVRVRLSDPVRCVFFSAAVDVRQAGV